MKPALSTTNVDEVCLVLAQDASCQADNAERMYRQCRFEQSLHPRRCSQYATFVSLNAIVPYKLPNGFVMSALISIGTLRVFYINVVQFPPLES